MTDRFTIACAALVAGLLVGACGDEDEEENPPYTGELVPPADGATPEAKQDACEAVEVCGNASNTNACFELIEMTELSTECVQRMEEASCDDHSAPLPSWFDICFPPCTVRDARCHPGGTISQCNEIEGELRIIVSACDTVCAAMGGEWSGSCSSNYQGQASTTGYDNCWCRL